MQTNFRGFSLIELSLVLVILALLTQPLLIPLKRQTTERAMRITESRLAAAQEALLAHAALTGGLPCPDLHLDHADPDYGLAALHCDPNSAEGGLPFRTLGLPEGDAWNSRLLYRVDTAFTLSSGQPINLQTLASTPPLSVYDVSGHKLTSDAEPPVAILFSVGANGLADGFNAHPSLPSFRYQTGSPGEGFDDQLIWIGRPTLFATLIRSGQGR